MDTLGTMISVAGTGSASLDASASPELMTGHWYMLSRTAPDMRSWLERAGVPSAACELLLGRRSRPRLLTLDEGCILTLRAANMNPGAEPEDMVSVRAWVTADTFVTLNRERVLALDDLQTRVAAGEGPTTPGALLVQLVACVNTRLQPVISSIEDELDDLEHDVFAEDRREGIALGPLRRRAIMLQRFVRPQRDALHELVQTASSLFDGADRQRLAECVNRLTRSVEDLDSIEARARVLHEELAENAAEQLNKRMYALTVIAALFLPVTVVTGVLGVNMGGMPGHDHPAAFALLIVTLLGLTVLELWLLRRAKWI